MEDLFEQYPTAFQYDCIECGPGWKQLLIPLLDYIHKYNEDIDSDEHIRVTQIKEKFGTLRFYTNWSNDELDKLIQEAEDLSGETCETCGEPGTLNTQGWRFTACPTHTKK